MNFERRIRYLGFNWKSRRLVTAYIRGDEVAASEIARYTSLADQVVEPKRFDPISEAVLREARLLACEPRIRDLHARLWRESRGDARSASPEKQQRIREAWSIWSGPRTALQFRYVVDLHKG